MIEQTQIYTTERCESSGRGEIFRAVVLCRQATQLLKSKARHLLDCPPGTRLQKIATGLGDFSNSLERAAIAVERGHHRKSPRASKGGLDLPGIEAMLTNSLRRVPIGSRKGRQLYALRSCVREVLASSPLENREMSQRALDQSAGGAA